MRDAGNVVASEGQIDATNLVPTVEGEMAHRTALQQSIDALVSGRPVDVSDTITPDLLRAYGERLDPVLEARGKARAAEESAFALEREGARLPSSMERLSELQLNEIRSTARTLEQEASDAFASLRGEADSLAARRAAFDERAPARDALRAEVEGLRTDLTAAEQRLAETRAPNDPDTQARLSAIEADLAAEGLPTARRVELEVERATITETLTATAPADARAIASLSGEAKGLRTALARKEKALARAEQTDARARAKLDKADADLPRRITAHEQRAAGRREAVTTEMRRTVARLAQDGYGVRLSREEAEQIAGQILGAGDDGADAVLRSVTEHLVDRALEQRRTQPAPPPGPGRPDPVAAQRARVGHWTDQTRKRIQGLAREVGYEMPREEAAIVAAAVARARTDDEALAILDELLLRPRTITETLPGTLAANRLQPAQSRLTGAALAVREDVYRQLIAAGEPEGRAAAGAAIWAARYDTRARRLGLSPEQAFDLYRKEGVDIRAAEAPEVLGPDSLPQSWLDRLKAAGVSTEVKAPPPAAAARGESRGPVHVDAGAKEWTLYHGTEATTDFERFDPENGTNPHTPPDERGLFLAPSPGMAATYASGTGATEGAGPRIFKVKVDPGRFKVLDLPEMIRSDPEFIDLLHAANSDRQGRGAEGSWIPANQLDAHSRQRLADQIAQADTQTEAARAARAVIPDATDADIAAMVERSRRVMRSSGALSAAVRYGQQHGYDTIVVRGLMEHDGADQVVVLRPDRVFSAYSGEKLYQRRSDAPKVSTEVLRGQLKEQFPSVEFWLGERDGGNVLVLDKIAIPAQQRGAGVGTQFMRRLLEVADQNGQTVALTPSGDFGGSKSALERWYRSLGFVPNKGRKADHSISEAMYRPPGGRFFQENGGPPRGAITMADNRAVIELFQGRDASTFMHESSHLWLSEMVRDAEVSPAVKADLDVTLRWLGVDDAAKIGRAEQEKWAQGFEQYLRDGKAPSSALARAFEQFKEWLTSIYRAVSDLGDPIPDDIRGVMDRMLAVPEQEVAPAASPSRAAPVRPEQLAALAPELMPAKVLAARSSEETEAAVLHDLDKLRATRDLQIPVGERLDETGARVADMRSVDELMDEADARLAAAAEIRACAMPMPEVTL
ncbi:hypothetical protein EZH22_14015 [Xanthobacter dioxanivorans]|uniref:N-acetyltransferase domain-containing protein n=1 Tax=Xanthobacter dioxanivorans TaxID=2528964 RepID=A0A974PT28_9HYPH|nr:hypothetical protein [Xanthobacter dioxanivorans]QRG09268.1 hypothetical protein EZH22_14015 [Xanthobacter dioxanivorans]